MNRVIVTAVAAVGIAASWATTLSAQLPSGPAPGNEIASVDVKLGMLSPQTTFTDESFGESSFDNGLAVGFSAAAWPLLDRRVGIKGQVVRSKTEGTNSISEFAPIAINDPTVYLYTLEVAIRHPMEMGSLSGFPYLSLGYGGKHYTWAVSQHREDKFIAWTGAAGYELRLTAMGAFGLTAELRGYQSNFRAFGIDDGTWEFGHYGGNVGGVKNVDLLFSTGVSLYF